MTQVSAPTCTSWLLADRPIKQEVLEEPDILNNQENVTDENNETFAESTNGLGPVPIKSEIHNLKQEVEDAPCSFVPQVKMENKDDYRSNFPIKTYSCPHCPNKFPKPILLAAHVRQFHIRPYSCTKCNKSFYHEVSCELHMKTHDQVVKPFKCNLCSRAFIMKLHLDEHLRSHYGNKPFSCTTCGKSFRTFVLCKQHMKVHAEGYECLTCNICFQKLRKASSLAAHLVRHAQRQEHTCPECGKVFSAARLLSAHRRTHAKPFACNVCNRRFTARHTLNKHIANHTDTKMLFCVHCCKAFRVKRSLTVHLRTHEKEFPHMCPSCGQGFTQEAEFEKHRSSVCCKKRYDCETCGRTYQSPSGLNRHLRSHAKNKVKSSSLPERNNGPVAVSKSTEAENGNSTPAKRNRHPQQLNIRVCGQCYCVFTTSSAFTKHVLQHWKHSKTTCSSCRKRFSSGRILTQHYASHAKVHKCPHCSVTFTRIPVLTKHVRKHKFERSETKCTVLKCRKCGEICTDFRSYVAHARILCGYALARNKRHPAKTGLNLSRS